MLTDPTVWANSEYVRDYVDRQAGVELANMFRQFADQLHDDYLMEMSRHPYSRAAQGMLVTEGVLRERANEIYRNVANLARSSNLIISRSVLEDALRWASSKMNLPVSDLRKVVRTLQPDFLVNALINGNVYKNGWNLSSAIWGQEQAVIRDIYRIVAHGVATGESYYETAEKLRRYVNHDVYRTWNLVDRDGMRIYPRNVEYHAQRLVRTLNQHIYQESLIAQASVNPFIEGFIWHASGPRPCSLCEERDGQFYAKEELPFDHPNGMCTFETAIDPDIDSRLAAWFWSPAGTYPEIDRYAEALGFNVDEISL